MGQIGARTASTPSIKSQSVLKAKLSVIEMQASSTKDNTGDILADISNGERNRTLT